MSKKSHDVIATVKALRTLMTEYNSTVYTLRYVYNDAKVEALAATTRKQLDDAAKAVYSFLTALEDTTAYTTARKKLLDAED